MDDTLADPLVGRLLDGRYAVMARIAHGGMATVYRAVDTRLDREVALKVMHADLARDEDFVRRFIGEAKSVARLSHQNVVAVFDQGTDGPYPYLAMEYVPGRTLKDVLKERGRFSPAAALDIMTGVLDGLAAAHASGIVHRDVKPENVLLTPDGRLKVADFGLAKAQAAAGHTRTGLLIGTVAYLPPEQVTGESMGPRSDVYSAGVMLFELLTGKQPFTGDSPLAVAYQHVNFDVPAPSSLVPGLPPAVDQLVLAATSRDPARPADAGEFARAVRQVREAVREPSGLTGAMGAGVQGTAEAPWLSLDTPAATNGWWAREAAGAAAGGALAEAGQDIAAARFADGTGPGNGTGVMDFGPGPGGAGTGSYGTNGFAAAGPGAGGSGEGGGGSHTLVVHRDQDDRFGGGGREPFLQRWLFSPRLAIVVLVLAVLAGLGFGGWYLTSGRYASIPVVAGDSVAQATAALTTDGFKVAKTSSVHSNEVKQGTVVGTTPTGRAAKGTPVTIVVSSGPFTSVVPKVTGDKLAAAEAALKQVHLTWKVQNTASAEPVGTVVGTQPDAGTSWPQTKPVTILVAVGLPIPNFVGEDLQTAQLWASQHGANLNQQNDQNSDQPQNTITGQEPAANSIFQQGETITINVSTGPAEVNVPDTIGMSVDQATRELRAAGFKVQVESFGLGNNGNRRVWNYSPLGQAPKGSTILLQVLPGNNNNQGGF